MATFFSADMDAALPPNATGCTCSDRGTCTSPGGSICACHSGYSGAQCEAYLLPVAVCAHNCSGRGTCRALTGVCECMAGFRGAGCEEVDERTSTVCPRNCCGNGRCKFRGGLSHAPLASLATKRALGKGGDTTATPYCECEAPWAGEDCCSSRFVEACPDSCSGHGTCIQGRCKCRAGWQGLSCSGVDVGACPAGCSGHGECLDGKCYCERGFSGLACDLGDAFGPSVQNAVQPLSTSSGHTVGTDAP